MKNIQNKIYFLIVLFLVSCTIKGVQNEYLTEKKIIGEWKQVNMRILNDDGHMATPNKWIFEKEICKLKIANPRVYKYEIENQEIKLDKVKEEVYEDWENILFFEKRLLLEITDTTMVWSRKDTLEVLFERY